MSLLAACKSNNIDATLGITKLQVQSIISTRQKSPWPEHNLAEGVYGRGHTQRKIIEQERAKERSGCLPEKELLEWEAREWKKNHCMVVCLCLAPARVRKCTHQGTKHIHDMSKE